MVRATILVADLLQDRAHQELVLADHHSHAQDHLVVIRAAALHEALVDLLVLARGHQEDHHAASQLVVDPNNPCVSSPENFEVSN